MALPFILLLAAAILAFGYTRRLLTLRHDSREPPLISADIPLVGHMIGLIRYGISYYARLRYHILRGHVRIQG